MKILNLKTRVNGKKSSFIFMPEGTKNLDAPLHFLFSDSLEEILLSLRSYAVEMERSGYNPNAKGAASSFDGVLAELEKLDDSSRETAEKIALAAVKSTVLLWRADEHDMEPEWISGCALSTTNKEKGSAGAAARWGDRSYLNKVIADLAARKEWGEFVPIKDLWGLLFCTLDQDRMRPIDTSKEQPMESDLMTWEGNREGVTYKRFRNMVGEYRKGMAKK